MHAIGELGRATIRTDDVNVMRYERGVWNASMVEDDIDAVIEAVVTGLHALHQDLLV